MIFGFGPILKSLFQQPNFSKAKNKSQVWTECTQSPESRRIFAPKNPITMKNHANYCFHFEKFRKKPLKVWESRIIEPMEIQRQRTGMIRAIVHDPQVANGWPPAYAKVRLLLIEYFRYLSHLGDKWMTDLIMDADKQMARKLLPGFRPGTIAASGRCPDSVRGLTFHRALILSLTIICHRCGVNIFNYFCSILDRCAAWSPNTPIEFTITIIGQLPL